MLRAITSLLLGLKEYRGVMLGLDGAGKTTILHTLKYGRDINWKSVPTQGFHIESVEYLNDTFLIRDCGWGNASQTYLTEQGDNDACFLIFVIDSADIERIPQTCHGIRRLTSNTLPHHRPLLVYANKQDVPGALSPTELSRRLDMDYTPIHKWHVQGCQAVDGDGLCEGLEWLQVVLRLSRN